MTEQELQRILGGESNSLDWKRGGDPEQIVKTLVAFANDFEGAGIGYVVCGVGEQIDSDGRKVPDIVGISISETERIHDRIFEFCRKRTIVDPPLNPQFDVCVLSTGKNVLVVSVTSSSEVHSFRNTVFIRLGDRTAASTQDQSALAQRKAHLDWLSQPCPGATMDDINYFALEEISKGANSRSTVTKFLEPEARMFGSAQPLTTRISEPAGDKIVPNRFALLLIGEAPQKFLPGAFVKLTRFPGLTRADQEFTSTEFFGPIPRLIDQVMEVLDAEAAILTDKTQDPKSGSQNRPRYNQQALREILVNALAHRDYRSDLSTKIYIFQDRIEFESPGGFVELLTIEQATHGQTRWRNPSLARYLVALKLAQETGTGIPTAIELTLEVSGKQPIFEVDSWFKVTIPAHVPPPRPNRDSVVSPEAGVLMISIGHAAIHPPVVRRSHHAFMEIADEKMFPFHRPALLTDESWPKLIHDLRNWLRDCMENVEVQEFHLFYRGPIVVGPLIGAIAIGSKPLIVYYYDETSSSYKAAYRLDRRLIQEP